MKRCTKCGITKPICDYYRNPQQKSGRDPACKACKKAYHAALYRGTREVVLERNRKWLVDNKEKQMEITARWRKARPEKARLYTSRWKKKNPALAVAQGARRRAAKKSAVPKWANRKKIAAIYDYARYKTQTLGLQYHVDHIVPLQHKLVCGLHVQDNLRVLLASINHRKYNKEWPDMPGDPY